MVYLQDSIVLFGDSITQGGFESGGFAARLAHVYNRKLDIINRGFGGYTAPWSLFAFKKFWPTREQQKHFPPIRLLTIWFGANDSCLPGARQHIPFPDFQSTLSTYISLVRSPESEYYSPKTRIVLITPPPFDPTHPAATLFALDRNPDITKKYAEGVKEIGRKENVPVVDAWTELWESAGKDTQGLKELLSDGLHLTKKGYDLVYESLLKTVQANFPELYPDNLEQLFPPWDQIDPTNPEKTVKVRTVIKQA